MTTETQHPETVAPTPAVHTGAAVAAIPSARGRRKTRGVGKRLFVHAALLFICALAILPFAWMVSTSLKTLDATMSYPPQWWPSPIQWQNYADVFRHEKANFLLWTRNTLIVAVLGVAGTTLSSAIVAYGFAKIRFVGRGLLFALMLSTMM